MGGGGVTGCTKLKFIKTETDLLLSLERIAESVDLYLRSRKDRPADFGTFSKRGCSCMGSVIKPIVQHKCLAGPSSPPRRSFLVETDCYILSFLRRVKCLF